ncbi:MAG: HAD-IIIA family hydrolase [Bdellovibrionales bacterium]|nr:HAD-IIIA family hydrolase [Bdellovibrionales bacterium]
MEILYCGKNDLSSLNIKRINDLTQAETDDVVYVSPGISDKIGDLEYFIKNTTPGNWAAYSVIENKGLPLFNFENKKTEILNQDYADGGLEIGLYRGNKKFISQILEKKTLGPMDFVFMGPPRNDYNQKRPAMFLDRDGIINKDHGYSIDKNMTELIPGIGDLIRWANQNNMYVCVLTNQSGVARGLYTEAELKDYHLYLENLLLRDQAYVDSWEYCPYHFKEGIDHYAKKSFCRKPWPGMALKACELFPIDLGQSIMIGDKLSDALDIKGLRNFHLKGQYELSGSKNPIFNKISEVIGYLS